MRNIFHSPFTIILFLLLSQDLAYSQTIIKHLGANDPISESFTLEPPGNAQLSPVVDDLGFDAWSIDTNIDSYGIYRYWLPPEHQELIGTQGWLLRARLRIVDPSQHAGLLRLFTGSALYSLTFSTDINGDPAISNSLLGDHTVTGGAGNYHEFSITYDVATEVAALWIDGMQRSEIHIPAGPAAGQAYVMFGSGESISHTYWNEVTLTTIPEPTTVTLLTGLGTLLIAGVLRRRTKKT